ncbi:MAG: preprotein translocase subunit SecY [Pseudomonadota bacterium]|nr:preprotein translocase subunit SecY [Pseudomonadota bacterium]
MKRKSGANELKYRILFVLFAIFVFRVGAHIPLPGIDLDQLSQIFQDNRSNAILGYFDMFTGGALSNMSLLSLGIMPYISSSICMQFLSYSIPSLEQLRKHGGETGRQKINQYTRQLTLLISVLQSFGVSKMIAANSMVILPPAQFYVLTILSLTTGTMFMMWLGDQITRYGIGNGISILIFSGIVSRFPEAFAKLMSQAKQGQTSYAVIAFVFLLMAAVVVFIVYMERGQRQLQLTYPKRQQGNRMTMNTRSKLPLKINMVGILPPIIAQTLIFFPASIVDFFAVSEQWGFVKQLRYFIQPGEPLYLIVYVGLVMLFTYYLTALFHDSNEIAKHLKRQGALIGGIRPGQYTAQYIDGVLSKLTFFGGMYLAFVSILPDIVIRFLHIPLLFGGTSLLIAVVCVMDVMSQVQTYLIPGHTAGVQSNNKLNLLK